MSAIPHGPGIIRGDIEWAVPHGWLGAPAFRC